MYLCDPKRMETKIKTFSQFGATGNGGITRHALLDADIAARREFVKCMETIGAKIEYDDMGNIYATLAGSNPEAKRIVMGSHTDSVPNGGNYDGVLGVMAAMEVLETVVAENIPHEHPLTAIIWTNEEGTCFKPTLGSSATISYEYLPKDLQAIYQHDDIMKAESLFHPSLTFEQALKDSGFYGKRENRLTRDNAKYMFEMHIEQGPILETAGNNIGVVNCVFGMRSLRVSFEGQTVHAGTFPMNHRKDALYAAAQAICYLHEEIDKLGYKDLVYTTGEITCKPCVHNCVPNFADFSIEVRYSDGEVLEHVEKIVHALADKKWAGCKCKVVDCWRRETVYWDEKLVACVEEAAKELDTKYQFIHSGAGHDAQIISYLLPTTMIFVPSKGGLSHCEEEWTSVEDCTLGASVMLNAILKADKK